MQDSQSDHLLTDQDTPSPEAGDASCSDHRPCQDYPPYVSNLLMHLKNKMQYAEQGDIDFAEKAFYSAYELHKVQTRKSGEPYFIHPYEVALILTELNASGEMIAAGFLHDILEDTDYTPEEMEATFGRVVLHLVDGVTKLGQFSFSSKEERQAENFRRMFMAMAKDIRVVIIKLADRLHNMRTLDHMAEHKQKKKAQETLDIFAPLAHRLGIGRLKWELEDLCLRYLHPEHYWNITQHVAIKRTEREATINNTIETLTEAMRDSDYAFKFEDSKAPQDKQTKITGRPKNFYSIYNKLVSKNKSFDDIHDYFGVRVLVPTEVDCYTVLGLIHALWKPIPGRFKDYIAMPKQNMYQSLHTTVISDNGHPLEVQIRTHEMDRISEFGIAAHWKYKENGGGPKKQSKNSKIDLQLTWLRQLLDWQNDLKDAEEYMSNIKDDLFEDDVYVFTPRGDVHCLPRGATAIDFAYRIHTRVGDTCVGAKMNGRIISLGTPLENGSQVEIMTSKNGQPSLDWINYANTNQAKNNIRKWFKRERREENIKRGRELLEAEYGKEGFEQYLRSETMQKLARKFNRQTVDDLLATIGYGEITPKQLLNRLKTGPLSAQEMKNAKVIGETVSEEKLKAARPKGKGILIGGEAGVLAFFPGCCTPVPGEPLRGVVTRNKGVAVHSKACNNLHQVNPKRFIPASWGEVEKSYYPVELEVYTIDRQGLLKDVIARLSDSKINILAANISTHKKDKTATMNLVVEVTDIKQLESIIQKIRTMADVLNVNRIVKPSRTLKKVAGVPTIVRSSSKRKKK